MQALSEYNRNPAAIGTASITFADIYEQWKTRNTPKMTPSVLSGYETVFKHSAALHYLKMSEIRTAHMQSVMDAYPNAKGSQTRMRTLWRQLFRLALEQDIVRKNYADFVDLKAEAAPVKSRIPFTKAQIETLWANVDTLPGVDSVLIMIYTGVRPSEFLSIESEHVHLAERWIDLHGTKTKAAKRIVPIHKRIAPLIERRLGSGPLFRENGAGVTYKRYLRTVWNPIKYALDLKDLSPHCARHTAVSLMTAAGVDSRLLKMIVGHSDGSVTERYTHAIIESLVAAIDQLDI